MLYISEMIAVGLVSVVEGFDNEDADGEGEKEKKLEGKEGGNNGEMLLLLHISHECMTLAALVLLSSESS